MTGCFGCCLYQTKKNDVKEDDEIPVAAGSGGPAVAKDSPLVYFGNVEKVFTLNDLLRASAEVLGKGTFGTSYKASLDTGPLVVKRLRDVKVSESKFVDMFDSIGNIKHENLLPLKAYHFGKDEKLLVYDFMPMGSLSAILYRNRGAEKKKTPVTPLNWETRLGIIVGVARAIAYLHSLGPMTFHGNIKPSNILLTSTLKPRVSDYLPDQIAEPSKHIEPDVAGYHASEVTLTGKVSQKADAYSFGVVLLELLTGKTPIFRDEFTSEKVELRRWILSVVEDELTSQIFELDLLRYGNVEEDLVRLLQIAIDCTAEDPGNRPSMEQVRNRIEGCANFVEEIQDVHIAH